jgi:hypothetical protein
MRMFLKSSPCSADQSKIEVISNIYGSLADITSSVQSIFLAKNIDKRSDTHSTEDENETRLSKFCLNTGNFKLLKNHHLKFIYLIGWINRQPCEICNNRNTHRCNTYYCQSGCNYVISLDTLWISNPSNCKFTREIDENETRLSKFCLNTGNFKLLKNHHLKFIYLIGCFAVYGCRLQIAYIPPYARDCGISRRDIHQ